MDKFDSGSDSEDENFNERAKKDLSSSEITEYD